MTNNQLIEKFYTAFQNGDAETMAECYSDDAIFEDPAFGVLKNAEVRDMWRMLIERSKGNLEIVFSDIKTEGDTGTAKWEAIYSISKTGRKIHNKIEAKFIFRDGKIIDHRDDFNLWKWAGMALGTPGKLLGWTPFIKNKIRSTALLSLRKWQEKNN